jgi:hypothetical protein
MSYSLEKMKITSETGDEFEVMFNPESYSMTYENTFSPSQGVGSSGKEQTYSHSRPASLSLTLIFDNTGASGVKSSLEDEAIQDKVDSFLDTTTKLDGSLHRPPSVSVDWGSHIFEGFVESITVSYKVFDRDGKPIRAELDTTFTSSIEDATRESEDGMESADLTHLRTVEAGGNLFLMTQKIYNDPAFYIHVAKANKLKNFRKLEPGTSLVFPPVEK